MQLICTEIPGFAVRESYRCYREFLVSATTRYDLYDLYIEKESPAEMSALEHLYVYFKCTHMPPLGNDHI